MIDWIVRGGTVVDGTRAPARRADVAISGERIVDVGNLSGVAAKREIDATGKVVAPGFIDLHNHSDGWLIRETNFAPKTCQGFTTEVLMADGISYAPVRPHNAAEWIFYLRSLNALRQDEYEGWESLGDYLARLDRRTAQNSAVHVPYANLRVNACGWGRSSPDDFQLREIREAVRKGMDEGAVGLSTGLDYIAQSFASTEELVAACSAMSDRQGLYVTHVRYKRGLLAALHEAVEIALRAEVPLHISHLKASGGVEIDQVLDFLEQARREVDLSFDVYPYQPGSTMLNFLLPNECWERGPLAAL
ncbi:MAG: amidohydrolase family protein, partial [Planctomycetota bacterium]|nr:amidohydrolase family protein [Planctomycetota bacterium]